MEQFLLIVAEVGFPTAAAIGGGLGVFNLVRFFLRSVVEKLDDLDEAMLQSATETTISNNEMVKIDLSISELLGVKPDLNGSVSKYKGI